MNIRKNLLKRNYQLDIHEHYPRRPFKDINLPTSQPSHPVEPAWQPISNKHRIITELRAPIKSVQKSKRIVSSEYEKSTHIAMSLQSREGRNTLRDKIKRLPRVSLRKFEDVKEMAVLLMQQNQFCKRVGENVTVELVKYGEFRQVRKNEFLYKRVSDLQGLAVVLLGKFTVAHILDKYEFQTGIGDTLGESPLCDPQFHRQEDLTSFEFARAKKNSWVLFISARQLKGLRGMMGKSVTKQDIYVLESVIKRNFLSKKGLRAQ